MELAFIIFAAVHSALTAALTIVYVRNERKNVFVWRRLTSWGRLRRYCIAMLIATFAIVLVLAVVVLCIFVPPAPAGILRKAQDLAGRVDARLTPS